MTGPGKVSSEMTRGGVMITAGASGIRSERDRGETGFPWRWTALRVPATQSVTGCVPRISKWLWEARPRSEACCTWRDRGPHSPRGAPPTKMVWGGFRLYRGRPELGAKVCMAGHRRRRIV